MCQAQHSEPIVTADARPCRADHGRENAEGGMVFIVNADAGAMRIRAARMARIRARCAVSR